MNISRLDARLADRRYRRVRIYEHYLLVIRRSTEASPRELRDLARRALEDASSQR
jgi:hypothetical protein